MASPRAAAIHSQGVAADRLERLAAGCGLPRWDGAAGSDVRVLALLAGPAPGEDAGQWLPPFAAWIEIDELSDEAVGVLLGEARDADLFASLTTATANRLHLAGRLVAAVHARRRLSDAQRDDIELALHEAISNALVHGNLQIEGMKGLSVAALDRFSAEISTRMADRAFAGRRIEVSCVLEPSAAVIEVIDQGTGYERTDREGNAGASGRGLDLITALTEACEVLDRGRRIRMRFAL